MLPSQIEIQEALSEPHQLYVADKILFASLTSFDAKITFGYTNPAGKTGAVCTIHTNLELLRALADKIQNALHENKPRLESDFNSFIEKI